MSENKTTPQEAYRLLMDKKPSDFEKYISQAYAAMSSTEQAQFMAELTKLINERQNEKTN